MKVYWFREVQGVNSARDWEELGEYRCPGSAKRAACRKQFYSGTVLELVCGSNEPHIFDDPHYRKVGGKWVEVC